MTHDTADLDRWCDAAKAAAAAAGEYIVKSSTSFTVATKANHSDLVTSADLRSQEIITSELLTRFPDHALLGEEGADELNTASLNKPTWIVDPVDGTTNFVHSIPEVSVSIGLWIDDHIAVGVVYNPFRGEMFSASLGRGSFLNDTPISVSNQTDLQQAVVIGEFGYERSPEGIDRMMDGVRRLLNANIRSYRVFGSGALDMCYCAAGRVDAVYTGLAGEGWKPWDYAAAWLIAQESNAHVGSLDGSEFSLFSKNMICCTPALREPLLTVLRPTF
mmetsp:Transcript_2542/g.4428  ORF Transcript_2542/g.4428 Transcript_2542/m.4428 type:complete len:275 (+) Transcript_2542:1342-2166(+)